MASIQEAVLEGFCEALAESKLFPEDLVDELKSELGKDQKPKAERLIALFSRVAAENNP